MDKKFPRLLYVGDVPVEHSIASGTLLFRIFEEYPSDSLYIVETDMMDRTGKPRLPDVPYETLPIASRRFVRTRFQPFAMAWEWIGAGYYARLLRSLVAHFAPQAVVAAVPFSSWAIASYYAQMCGLPLHLLLWDDILASPMVPGFLQTRYERAFLSAYRNAKSRFCISPQIEQFYADLSGARGTLVYPFGGRNLLRYSQPLRQPGGSRRRFTFAFAGSLFLGGYRRALAQFARACEEAGYDLILIKATDATQMDDSSLARSVVRMLPYITPVNTLIDFLRHEADALILVGSFESTGQRYCSLLFPSRLVVYAATALPCFGYGPQTFTGIDWLIRNLGKEVVCTLENNETLLGSLKSFVAARGEHANWGQAIARAGARDFGYHNARDKYFEAFRMH